MKHFLCNNVSFFLSFTYEKDKIDVIRKAIDINSTTDFECYLGNRDGNIKLFFSTIGINIKTFNLYD